MLRWNDDQLSGEGFVPWYPFDHPQLFIPNGPGAPRMIMPGDPLFEIPAVGRFGGQPQKKFLEP